jgi:ubiquinone/menaquinone biosynthesis C-methylase UbiE
MPVKAWTRSTVTVARMSGSGDGGRYLHGHHESVLRSHRWRTADNSAAYLLPRLRSGQSLLDVGCGPGTITADLAELVHPGRVTALEQSADVLDLAREELARRGVTNVDLVVGDVHALELADATFDVVHAHQVLQHVADPVRALRELRRVTRPGGVVAVRDSDYGGFVWAPHIPELDEWRALYKRLARAAGGEPDAGRYLLALAHEAGFADVVATSSTWCYATPEDRAWWGGLWADRVTASSFAQQALEVGGVSAADLERIAAGWRRWAGSPDGWFSVLHGEILATV